VPLREISRKVEQLEALGWREDYRVDTAETRALLW
jgi:hypothetical protein